MKHRLIIIAILLCALFCSAQATNGPKRNALSFELGKTGTICNASYDHQLRTKTFGFRLGVGSNFASELSATVFGIGGYLLRGKTNDFFEVGLDVQYLRVSETDSDQRGVVILYPDYAIETVYPSVNVGYRHYGKNTLFRIGLSPNLIQSKIIPGGYISYGFTF